MPNKIKIAILGSKGIPAKYGGFETITQELSVELAKRGFDVYVSCESDFFKIFKNKPYITYEGVSLVYFPIINSIRILSEVLYDALSVIWASLKVDVIYMLGYSSVIALLLPKLLKKIIIVNVDGLEWKRRKFNKILRFLLKIFEILTVKIVDYIVVDSHAMEIYYRMNYGVKPIYIPNGIREVEPYSSKMLNRYRLEKNEYYLVVARLEPENNVDLIIKGYKMSGSSRKLVIIGGLKRTKYVAELLKHRSKNILFLGGIYNRKLLMTFRKNCFAYIHGHEVGGTNPSLIEALSCGNVIIALDTPFNREVARNAAIYFKKNPSDLGSKIRMLENDVEKIWKMKKEAYMIYKENYNVKKMALAFENFLMNLPVFSKDEIF